MLIYILFYLFISFWLGALTKSTKSKLSRKKIEKNPKIFENPRGGTQYQSVGDK